MDGNLYQLELLAEIDAEEGLPCRVKIPFHYKNFMTLDLLDKAAAEGTTNIGGLDPASIDRDPVGQSERRSREREAANGPGKRVRRGRGTPHDDCGRESAPHSNAVEDPTH